MNKQFTMAAMIAVLMSFLCPTVGWAQKVTIDGINYSLKNGQATVGSNSGMEGDLVIPSSVSYKGKEYPVTSIEDYAFSWCRNLTSLVISEGVTSIGDYAFRGCSGLTSVNIPEGVTSIGNSVFYSCSGLTSVNIPEGVTSIGNTAFGYCTGLTSVTIPSSVTSIGNSAFGYCTGLTSVTIPSSVTSIGDYAFRGCSGLTSVTIPSSVTSIGSSAFSGCSGLTSVNIPSSVTSIGVSTFDGCSGLTSVTIPSSVTSIGTEAFYGCTSLTSVRLPESVTFVGDRAFNNCSSLMELVVLSRQVSFGEYYGAGGNLYAYQHVLDSKKWNCKKIAINNSYYAMECMEQKLVSLTFQIKEIKHEQTETDCSLVKVECDGKTILSNEEGNYILNNLFPGETYNVTVVVLVNDKEYSYEYPLSTLYPSVGGAPQKVKQTGLRIELTSWQYDEAMLPIAMGVELDGKIYETESLGKYSGNSGFYSGFYGTVNISGLVPVKEYSFLPYIKFKDGKKYYGSSTQFKTIGISPIIVNGIADATTFRCDGKYTEGTATFERGKFIFNGEEYEGNSLLLTGLTPNTSYSVKYTATTKEGSEETSSAYQFKTEDISLVTENPRCVSNTCAIVAATTNISDDETNVGFQWKKYDAPASLAPNEGYAAIYDGKLEGHVKNLQSAFYYNVRAFYKSASGNYYYGNWVTFDPSDFSYFEPTVHTYEAAEIGSSSAKLKGYVLAGTDDIIEQGFEYWATGAVENRAMRVRAEVENNVSTVFGTGQIMTAMLTDLQPNTIYNFRSFVKTVSGTTYGEEQTFTTDISTTGIGNVETDTFTPVVIGYYDLEGRKYNEPQKGLNIIRYSDGSARKVFVN